MNRKYSKFLTITLIIIIIAVIGLLAFLGIQYYTNYKTNKNAQDAVEALNKGITVETPVATTGEPTSTETPTEIPSTADLNNSTTNSIVPIDNSTKVDNQGTTTKSKRTYQGFNMLGSIEIPKTKVSYPILEKVTKKSLEKAVAVIWPNENAVLNEIGNVVIVGHNYRNSSFFSNNKKLAKGDKIYITDLQSKKLTYIIYNIFETTDTDASFYNRDTNGKREITLSTCTDDATRRLIIEAREE